MKESHGAGEIVGGGRPSKRFGFVLLVSGVSLLGTEFDGSTFWFQTRVGGVPSQYLWLAVIILGLTPMVMRKPSVPMVPLLRANRLLPWLLLGGLGVAAAVLIGVWTSSPQPYVDWRNLVVMATIVILVVRWLGEPNRFDLVVLDLAIVYGLYAGLVLVNWLLGGGSFNLGQRIPTYDGAKLTMISFSSMVCLTHWMSGTAPTVRNHRWMVPAAGIMSSLVVALSFRRSYWLILGIGFAGFSIYRVLTRSDSRRSSRWLRPLLVGFAIFAVTVVFMGSESLIQRVESFAPGSENPFSVTNEDHVNDVLDALDVIRVSPILGYGIGREYQTQRIVGWKTESFDVHNAPVHVWLKFGLAGLIGYVGFHLSLIIRLVGRPPTRGSGVVWVSFGLFLAGEFVATLAGTWPYGSFQNSVFHAILFALALSAYRTETQNPDQILLRLPSRSS